MPERTRKIHVFLPMDQNSIRVVPAAMLQVKTRITVVRIAVARLELISVTPTFARSAVAPANNAESNAQNSHCIRIQPPSSSGLDCTARNQFLEYDKDQQQGAAHDFGPPAIQRAVEGDDGLDLAQNQH